MSIDLKDNLTSAFLVALSMFVVVIILWLPFGLELTPYQESWFFRAYVDSRLGTSPPNLYVQGFGDQILVRPVSMLYYLIPHLITPNSFLADNLLIIFYTVGKGFLLYLILIRLFPERRLFAFYTGLLFLFYPTGLLDFGSPRIPAIYGVIFTLMLAIYVFLLFWERPRWYLAVLTGILLALSALTYEVVYPVIFIIPPVFYWYKRKPIKQAIRLSLVWYVIPALTLAYFLWQFFFGVTVQNTKMLGGTTLLQKVNGVIFTYVWMFAGVWKRTILEMLNGERFYFIIIILAAFLAGIVGLIIRSRGTASQPVSHKEYLVGILIGLVLIGAGVAAYFPSNRIQALVDYTVLYNQWGIFRLFLVSSAGAAIVVSTLVYWISTLVARQRYRDLIYVVIMSILIGVGTYTNIHSLEENEKRALVDSVILTEMIKQVPAVKTPATFVVVLEDPSMWTNLFLSHLFRNALAYLYNDYYNVEETFLCSSHHFAAKCEFTSEHILINDDVEVPYDTALIFVIDRYYEPILVYTELSEFQLPESYAPMQLIDYNQPVPYRLFTVFRNQLVWLR